MAMGLEVFVQYVFFLLIFLFVSFIPSFVIGYDCLILFLVFVMLVFVGCSHVVGSCLASIERSVDRLLHLWL